MHKVNSSEAKPQYWVMLKLCEPKYETEHNFLQTEIAFAKRKLVKHKNSLLRDWSLPALGFYSHKDWQKYVHALQHYEDQLDKYQDEVEGGVLPVKFAVYNAAQTEDSGLIVEVHVADGRIDSKKKQPERPVRLDGHGKTSKYTWPKLGGFSRSRVKITPHSISAELSGLGPEDGAVLVNQLVHLHTQHDTKLKYGISSLNAGHETGEVELHDIEQS